MKKLLLSAGILACSLAANAQCTAVTTISEDFNSFEGDALPQNCWSKIASGPMVYIDGNDEGTDKYATYYSFMSPNVAGYLITPQLSTIDGNHKLSFNAFKTNGNVTVQVGVISDPANAESFTSIGEPVALSAAPVNYNNIIVPATDAGSYIAFKIVGDMPHVAAVIDNVVWEEVCAAQGSLEENFNTFTDDALPQNCWLKNAVGPMVYIDGNEEGTDRYVTFYSFMSPNVAGYLITPEIAASQDDYGISFKSFKIGEGNITVQVGTIANPEDQATFAPVGDIVNLTAAPSTYTVEIPALPNNLRLAFKVTADAVHHAAIIDDITLVSLLGTQAPVSAPQFTVYPNPSSNKIVTLSYPATGHTTVSIYNMAGAKVHETAFGTAATTQTLNLTNLSSGMYLVKLTDGNAVNTAKLILQ